MDQAILAKAPGSVVIGRYTLMILFFGTFLSAELALVIMALKVCLQDVLELSDIDLINRGRPASASQS
jgi:hypothetical protein